MFNIFIIASVLVITEIVNAKPLSEEMGTTSLTPYLGKKYKLTSSDDKFDEIMKVLNVGFVKRKLANLATPVMELKEENGVYTLSSKSTFKDHYVQFRMNEEFDETTPDDRVVRTIFTQDKNKLIQIQKGDGKTTKVTREFSPEKVTVTVEVDGIVSVRVYSAIKDD